MKELIGGVFGAGAGAGLGGWLGTSIGIAAAGTAVSGLWPVLAVGAVIGGLAGAYGASKAG